MWKFYGGLLLEIPGAFRSALETLLFWGWGLVSLVLTFFPTVFGLLPDGKIPRWVGPMAIALAFVYGLLRSNYKKFCSLQEAHDRLEKALEALSKRELQVTLTHRGIIHEWVARSDGQEVFRVRLDAVKVINRSGRRVALEIGCIVGGFSAIYEVKTLDLEGGRHAKFDALVVDTKTRVVGDEGLTLADKDIRLLIHDRVSELERYAPAADFEDGGLR